MKDFIEYIETSCAKLPDNHITYLYKKQILDEMTDRANEVTHSGLKDEKVLADLMADEYPNLDGNYYAKNNKCSGNWVENSSHFTNAFNSKS